MFKVGSTLGRPFAVALCRIADHHGNVYRTFTGVRRAEYPLVLTLIREALGCGAVDPTHQAVAGAGCERKREHHTHQAFGQKRVM